MRQNKQPQAWTTRDLFLAQTLGHIITSTIKASNKLLETIARPSSLERCEISRRDSRQVQPRGSPLGPCQGTTQARWLLIPPLSTNPDSKKKTMTRCCSPWPSDPALPQSIMASATSAGSHLGLFTYCEIFWSIQSQISTTSNTQNVRRGNYNS